MDATGAAIVVGAEKAGDTWDILAGQVQAFLQAWDSRAEPPNPAEFLPKGTAVLRRLVLLELIKVDLDYRWSRGQSVRIVDDYLAAFPELAADGPPCDLLYEEYHIRKRAGDSVQPGDYLLRYPGRADELARQPTVSLRMLAGRSFIAPQIGTTARYWFDRMFESAGVEPHVVVETNEIAAMQAYVKLGIGVAITPRSVVPHAVEPAVAVPLAGFPELQIVLAWHETGYRTPAAQRALAFAREVASQAEVD